LIIVCAGLALVVIVVLATSAYWDRKQRPFQNAPRLISALQALSRDQAAGGRRLPPEVSLHDLLRGGYLTARDVAAFEGMDVTFSTQADDTHPQMVLARARTRDGQYICLLADGSVQQLSKQKYEQQRGNLDHPAGEADGSQPFSSETNRTPAATGSRRWPTRPVQ
jgi:hypothetical protein